MTDDQGRITLAKAYNPYGEVTQSAGGGQSSYGYTNEYQRQGLIYLRARMYAPADGRFQTRDTWQGDYNRPGSLNRWSYVEGNPINNVDPSGYISEKQSERATLILDKLNGIYGVYIKKDWGYTNLPSSPYVITGITLICGWEPGSWRDVNELESVLKAVKTMSNRMGGPNKFRSAMKGYIVNIYRISSNLVDGKYAARANFNSITIPNYPFTYTTANMTEGVIVHELAHVWDAMQWSRLSTDMMFATKSYRAVCGRPHGLSVCDFVYEDNVAIEEMPTDYKDNEKEDWADSFMVFVYPSLGKRELKPIRKNFIEDAIKSPP